MPQEPPLTDALAPEDEAAVIATIPPRILLRSLQSLDGVSAKVLAGFRANTESLKLPAVRARLQRESATNPELHQALREAWAAGHDDLVAALTQLKPAEIPGVLADLVQRWGAPRVCLALRLDPREAVREIPVPEPGGPAPLPVAPAPKPPEPKDLKDATRTRDQVRELKEELAHARKELAKGRAQAEAAERSADRWETATRAALGEVSDLRHAQERATRQLEREQKAKAELDLRYREAHHAHRQAVSELEALRRRVEEEQRLRAVREAACPGGDAWLAVARSLIAEGHAQAVVGFLAPILKGHPDSDVVRDVLAEAYQAVGAPAVAVTELCLLARKRLKMGDLAEAVTFASRALACAPDDRAARLCMQEVVHAAAGRELPRSVMRRLEALRKRSPELRGIVSPLCPPPEAPQGAAVPSLDAPIEWPGDGGILALSLRTVFTAVDTGREDVVTRVREGLRRLQREQPKVHAAALKAVRAYDESYLVPLIRKTQPVVVDGSNVAWDGSHKCGRPRLAHILSMRQELRGLGYFPIRIYVDAALVYQIDRRADLEALIGKGEVQTTDAGRDGDEQILQDARETGCPVVSNDRMAENDPEGVVPKIRFEVGPDGAAIRHWHAR